MRKLQTMLLGTFMFILVLANVFLMHRHQHLEEVMEEKDKELKGLKKDRIELGQAKPSQTGGIAPANLPPATGSVSQPPRDGAATSEEAARLRREVLELQAQLRQLPRLQNKSAALEYKNEDLEEELEDLKKEVDEKQKSIEFYVSLQKQQEQKHQAESVPSVKPGEKQAPSAAAAPPRRIGREKYQRVRDELRLDEDIVITGSGGPPNCNLFCNTGGFGAGCPPTCVFKPAIIVPETRAAACIFNGHRMGDVPEDVREYGCIPVAEGMESEVNYKSLVNHRTDPETWTRTYHRTADAPAPYYSPQEVRMRHPEATRPLKDRIKGAVAVISNCKPAERKEVIRILRQHIKVAFMGKCGDDKWPEDCNGKCTKFEVLTKYMVYLAFENSHTQDYATEKLYDGLSTNSITVAFGAPNSVELAPRDSIINIGSVAEADAVGQRLKAMLEDPELKEATRITQWHMNLAWRPEWEEKMGFTRFHSDCRLCETLRKRVVVATGGDVGTFVELRSTVGSVQKWEKGRGIMVFDMGLNEWQKDQVRQWQDVALVELPEYSRDKSWKLRVHAVLFAVHAAGKALWLDAGTTVANRLAAVDVAVERHGLFLAQEGEETVGERVRGTALFDLGLPPEETRATVPLLSAAVQAHSDFGLAYERVLIPLAQCVAQDPTCAVGPEPVNYTGPLMPLPDQGVLSVVAQTSGTQVHAGDNARVAFGNGSHPGLFQRPGKEHSVVYKKGACVHPVGHPEEQATVAYYALRGNHKIKKSGTTTMHGKDLEACSSHLKHDVSIKDHNKELMANIEKWTGGGLVLEFDKDVPKGDMAASAFVHIPQNRKATLMDCAKECWVNAQCLAFSYDAEIGECWPKMQNHEMGFKAGVVSANLNHQIKTSKQPAEWLALWGTR